METVATWENQPRPVLPSMGPPPFGDGNKVRLPTDGSAKCPLQWGHRLSAMETSCRPSSGRFPTSTFNGATAFRRWKRCGNPAKSILGNSAFNGATAFRRWKPWRTRRLVLSRSCFNGATAFRRWKRGAAAAAMAGAVILQWGHRLSAMETGRLRQPVEPIYKPSMGPPPFGDGNYMTRAASLI